MGKYDPLHAHLRRQRTAVYEMSFADIERLIRSYLPKRARQPAWWSNTPSRDARTGPGRAWLDAGYNATLLKPGDRVRFERAPRQGA